MLGAAAGAGPCCGRRTLQAGSPLHPQRCCGLQYPGTWMRPAALLQAALHPPTLLPRHALQRCVVRLNHPANS